MFPISKISNWFAPRAILRNATGFAASEFEQGVIRIVFLTLVLVYFLARWSVIGILDISPLFVALVLTYFVISLVLLASFWRWPVSSTKRRVVSLVLDLGLTTYGAYISWENLSIFFAIYLWLIIGYGARYGQRYLGAATVIGATGFSIVVATNEYFRGANILFGLGLIFSLIIIPLFVSELIRRSEKAKREAETSRAEAESANLAKSQFLATMSHELRTPLMGLIGTTNLLTESALNDQQKEYARIIQSSSSTLLSLIDNILDISKIEAGRIIVEKEECDIIELVRRTVEIFRTQATERGIALRTVFDKDVPKWVLVDAHHLKQVLLNLLGNAVKFTQRGYVLIRLATKSREGNDYVISIEVTDSGIGIPTEAQEIIFERFTQADQSTTRRFGGSGLGMAITKHLVELMGGQIGLESTPGKGSTFSITVPVTSVARYVNKGSTFGKLSAVESTNVAEDSKLIGNTVEAVSEGACSKKILVVDDHSLNRRVIEMLLERGGHEVTLAESGAEALELFEEQSFDLVIVDLQMPDMDGIEVMQLYRFGAGLGSRTPFIVLSGDATNDTAARCRNAGAAEFLTKPVDAANLLAAISRVSEPSHDKNEPGDVKRIG